MMTVLGRLGRQLAIAAVAGIALGVFGAAAEAGTLTISFGGTAVPVSSFLGSGYNDLTPGGQSVSGTMTITADNAATIVDPNTHRFDQTSNLVSTFNFQIAGGASYSENNGAGTVYNPSDPTQLTGLSYNVGGGSGGTNTSLTLLFMTSSPANNYLSYLFATLSSTPTSLAAMTSYLGNFNSPFGGTPVGVLNFGNDWSAFKITSFSASYAEPAVTPIPATLPLFISALGGLGLLGYRRHKRA